LPERVITNIEGRQVVLSHLERLVYPQVGFIKAEIIKYYLSMASYLLPHLQDRPLVFTRYPSGVNEAGFYQKNAPAHLPTWINTYAIEAKKRYILANEKATLVWLSNHGCIEIHPWLSRLTSLINPDFMVFDLDPSPDNSWDQIVAAAMEIRHLLNNLHLASYPKTSGGKGLHIYVPIEPHYSYELVRQLAIQVANILVKSMPLTTTQQRMKAKRGPRIYIDCLQIGQGKTLCAPYSLRPTPKATVSTPLYWEEVGDINPSEFTLMQVLKRINKVGDLFYSVLTAQQNLNPALQAMLIPVSK